MMHTLVALLLAVALLTLYGPHVRQATFVYEDDRSLTVRGAVPTWVDMFTTGRGLTKETWRTIRIPQASHALNVGLHGLVVLLAGWLVWLITRERQTSWSVAAIMALHPLTVESVAYATSRAELLAAVGALGALVAVLARARWAWLGVLPCLLLAYAGKETGLVAVALIPLVLWAAGRETRAAWWVIGATLAVTSAIWLPRVPDLAVIGFTPRMSVDGVSWVLLQAEAVWRLVVLSLAPFWLSVTPTPTARLGPGLAALLLLLALLEVAWWQRQRRPLLTLGIVWCAIVAAPRFVVRTPLSPFNEHQWYLAMPGVACALIGLIDLAARRWHRPAVEAWA